MASEYLKPQADKVKKTYDYATDAWADALENSERSVRYLNNDTWTSEEKDKAKTHGKPTLTYNIIVPIISTLQGNEQLNAKRAKFKPTTLESVDLWNIVQDRWNLIVDEQEVEEKIQTAFVDALTTRMGGWIERSVDMTEEGYLDFNYRVINNMRIYPDPETRASDYKLKQCRWIIKEGWEPLDVIKQKYTIPPEDLKSEDQLEWYDELNEVFLRFQNQDYSSSPHYDKENDRYKVLEMQERVFEKMVKVFDGTTYKVLTVEQYNKLKKKTDLQKLMEFEQDAIRVTTVIPYFDNVLVMDKKLELPVANFDVFPIFSYSHNIQISEQTSLVDLLIDVQDDVNKSKSQARDYVTQILSGGVFIDKREKEAIKQLKQKGNQPHQVYELNNPGAMPQQMPPGQMSPDILNSAENSYAYAMRVSMVNEAMRGETARSGESGVLFEQKVQRAAAAINPYFRNVSRLRKALAEDFVDMFPYVYSEENRMLLVMEADNQMFAEKPINLVMGGQMVNDVRNLSIYVELDEGNDNITQKEDNFNRLLALNNLVAQINPAMIDLKTLVMNAPVHGKNNILEYMQQVEQAQAEAQQAAAQAEQTKQTLENAKVQRGMQVDDEKLNLEKVKTKIAAQEAAEKNQILRGKEGTRDA